MKKEIIKNMVTAAIATNREIILATPAGIICGHFNQAIFRNGNEVLMDDERLLFEMIADVKEHGSAESTEYCDGCMVLSGTSIENGQHTANFAQIVVFYDQIIGISLGDFLLDSN